MDQHGWTDRAAAKSAVLSAQSAGGGSSCAGGSFLDFQDFDAGASLFSGAAAVVVGAGGSGDGSNASPQRRAADRGSGGRGGRAGSGTLHGAAGEEVVSELGKPASPGMAEKAAATVAAMLPAFRPKETVSEFLTEVSTCRCSSRESAATSSVCISVQACRWKTTMPLSGEFRLRHCGKGSLCEEYACRIPNGTHGLLPPACTLTTRAV